MHNVLPITLITSHSLDMLIFALAAVATALAAPLRLASPLDEQGLGRGRLERLEVPPPIWDGM